MKLEIQLVDTKESRLGGAELTLFLVLKSGKEMTLGPRSSNGRSEVSVDEFTRQFFKSINFAKSQYIISYKGMTTSRLPLGQPNRVSNSLFRYILVAKDLGNTPINEERVAEKKQSILVETISENGKDIIPNATVIGVWKDEKESTNNLPEIITNDAGITVIEWKESFVQSIPWAKVSYDLKHEARKFSSIRFNGPQKYDGKTDFRLQIFATESIVEQPTDHSENNNAKTVPVLVSVQDQNKQGIEGLIITGSWLDLEEKPHQIKEIVLSKDSQIIDWDKDSFPSGSDQRKGLTIEVSHARKTYKLTGRNGPVKSNGGEYDYQLQIFVEEISRELADIGSTTGPRDSGWVVYGIVTEESDEPSEGIIVRVFDKNIGEQPIELGIAQTAKNGRYRIYYSPDTFAKYNKKSPDLLIKIYKSIESKKKISSSGLIAKAGPHERVDISTSLESWKGIPLYLQLLHDTEPLLKGNSPKSLDIEDVALLADKTNNNAIVLAHFVRAWDLIEDLEIGNYLAAPFFALTAGGIKPILSAILGTTDKKIRRLLDEAISANWIPKIDTDVVIKKIGELREKHFSNSNSDLAILLGLAGVAKSSHGKVISIVLTQGDNKKKWLKIEDIIGLTKKNKLKDLIEVWRTLQNDVSLTVVLSKEYEVSTIDKLVLIDKAGLLKAVSSDNEMPHEITGKNTAEQEDNYADSLLRLIEQKHAHTHFLQNLSVSDVREAKSRAQMMLQRNDIRLDDPKTLRVLPDESNELADLATLYLVCPVLGRANAAEVMMTEKFMSSMDVVKSGKPNFLSAIRGKLEDEIANKIYMRADHLGSVQTILNVANKDSNQTGSTTLLGQLFSDAINDSCTHCNSILGPSAYLLDLYRYLERALVDGQSGADILNTKRPDIIGINLDCENSDVLLPHIDLTLEVLESVVASEPLESKQTGFSPEQLLAKSEHVNFAAYTELNRRTFPWGLPYSRDIKRVKSYLEHLGINIVNLTKLSTSSKTKIESINSQFEAQFSTSNLQTITIGSQPKWLANWGVSNRVNLENRTNGGGQKKNLADLSSWLQIEVKELSELLNSTFIGQPNLVSQNGKIKWDELTPKILTRLQFLGRLTKQTDFSVTQLTSFFELEAIDETTPVIWRNELVAIAQLSEKLGIDKEMLIELFTFDLPRRDTELSILFALSEDDLTSLKLLSHNTISKPSELVELIELIEKITYYNFSIEDFINLLGVASDDHRFSQLKNKELLNNFREGIEKIVPPELFNTDSDDVINNEQEAYEGAISQTFFEIASEAWEVSISAVSIALTKDNSLIVSTLINQDGINEDEVTLQLSELSKMTFLIDQFGISKDDFELIQNTLPWSSVFSFPVNENAASALSLLDFLTFFEYQRVNQLYYSSGDSFFHRIIKETINDSTSLINALTVVAPWNNENLSFLFSSEVFNISTKSEFLSSNIFVACRTFLETASSLTCTAEELWLAIVKKNGDIAQSILRNKITTSEFYNVLEQLNNPLRESNRDALLVAAISDSRNKGTTVGFRTSLDFYEHYLIDPDISSCFLTSRIKQTTSSLQQLTQRILLGLEGSGGFNTDDQKQWNWRKNYRVWEANRKVFIQPENWIEPELRDNKTQLYEDLETELLQGEVNEERAEKSLLNYTRGLLSLSRMEMVATLEDEESSSQHVFARSSDHPRKYYWCTRERNGLWGGWKLIDQEIEGDHVLPVIYSNRLFLFWLTLVEKVNTAHESYRNTLAEYEASEEIARGIINELNRRIKDFVDLIEKYREYADNHYGGASMVVMWDNLANSLEASKAAAEDEFETATHDLASLKSRKDYLAMEYTYFDCTLIWSQYHELTSWSPAKRAVESINTIYKKTDDKDDTHLKRSRDFWIVANPSTDTLDIELRTSAGNADGKSYDYRLGLFEFDPILEAITATDESQPPKIEKHYQFQTLLYVGQSMSAVHPLPMLDIDGGENDQHLISWDRDIGAKAYPEKIEGYDPRKSPFLFSSSNRSYIFDPIDSALGLPLIIQKNIPRIPVAPQKAYSSTTNYINPRELSAVNTTNPVFSGGGLRKPATPLGKSTGRLANGRESQELVQNLRPANINDWKSINKVMKPIEPNSAAIVGGLTGAQKWKVSVFYHPFSEILIAELYRRGLDGLYMPDAQSGNINATRLKHQAYSKSVFAAKHSPSEHVELDTINEEQFDFDRTRPYSIYNWELFFHAPFAIAKQLTQNRKYEEARRWFHFIFDPVANNNGENNATVWRLGPFFKEHQRLLQGDNDELSEFTEENFAEFQGQVSEWENNPFNPHAIARMRNISYMRATYIAYLDNIMEWADNLFRRDTMESVAEAAQLYIHASQLLGPAPIDLSEIKISGASQTLGEYDDRVDNVHPLLVAGGADFPVVESPPNDFFAIFGDFCIPTNTRIKEYWDTLSDRLFKIRHCMNIEGVERALALYQPPIDPALLVRAAAAGVDIGSAVSGLNSPRPHYRFVMMLQKAKEFASEVRSLGGALLSALEKKDGEELSQLRSSHELGMQKRILDLKKERLSEALEGHKSLEKSLFSTMDRHDYYQGLSDTGALSQEKDEEKKMEGAKRFSTTADIISATAAVLSAIPQTGTCGPLPKFDFGGIQLGDAAVAIGQVSSIRAGGLNRQASMLGRDASVSRRKMDWSFQIKQAKREIEKLQKDQIASEIRIAIAEKEIADQEVQITNSEQAFTFLKDKFTNGQLYGWMVSQLSGLHYQAYQMALDMAKQAEASMKFELNTTDSSFIEFGYWDSLKKGLLSGERLVQDLNKMDAYYLAKNKRTLELTKQISLHRLNSLALLDLRDKATCSFTIPEYIFDFDHPGHYKRRIKSVSITIPAISGPYTTIGCTLKLESSTIRNSAGGSDEIIRMSGDQIATSSAQGDSGLFQFDFRDERYLPFEGHGVSSSWEVMLPDVSIAQFDYSTISDVILTINYTSYSDESRRQDVIDNLAGANFGLAENVNFVQLLSLKNNFPDLWATVLSHAINTPEETNYSFDLKPEHFPYLTAGRSITISSCLFSQKNKDSSITPTTPAEIGSISGSLGTMNISNSDALLMIQDAGIGISDINILVYYKIN